MSILQSWSRHNLEDSNDRHLLQILIQPVNLGTTHCYGKMDFSSRVCPDGFSLALLASNCIQICKNLRGFRLIRSRPVAFTKQIPYPFHLLYYVFEDENEKQHLSVVGLFQKGTKLIIVSSQVSFDMRHLILPDIFRVFRSISLL